MMFLKYISNLLLKIFDEIVGYEEKEYETSIRLYRKNELVAIVPEEKHKIIGLGGKILRLKGAEKDVYGMLKIFKLCKIKHSEVE